ncbi:ATP-binding protein [Sorangium sp. So ce429]
MAVFATAGIHNKKIINTITSSMIFLAGAFLAARFGATSIVAFALTLSTTTAFALTRLPLYPFEAFLSIALYHIARLCNTATLQFTPVLYHEFSHVPHPFLTDHILLTARQNPGLVRQVFDACAIAPGQEPAGQRALSALQAWEIEDCARQHRFQRVIDLQTEEGSTQLSWLPGVSGAPPVLLAFRELARYLAAAENATIPHHRLKHLEGADRALAALENQLRADTSILGRALSPIVPAWQQVTREMHVKAKSAATGYLPNPFRPGDALNPELGREVFRGREDVVRQIEALLADASQSASIALLGPRRSGKSSLLKMLPALLPDAVCIFFDLQDHPTDSPVGFFRELQKEAREQARRDRRLDVPPLPEGSPFEAGSAWLKMLDDLAGDRRILLCIDEFERLETLFPGDAADLRRLMGLFRATIQHRRKLRLLVSGAAPFDELGTLWNDHFINVQEVRLDLLDRTTSMGLLTRPVPELPEAAIPEPVAARIYERTGGQPFLLQAYGFVLIQRLNDRQRDSREATLDDLAPVEETVLARWKPFFADTVNTAPPQARDVLYALAHDRTPELDNRTRRWLRHRCLLTMEDRLRVPVLGAWIRDELDG